MTRFVEVHHTFQVPDEVTDEQVATIVGTMTVQVEEPVVGYTEDSFNELTVPTHEITSAHTVKAMDEVWVVSYVYGITGDGDSDGGGFDWVPIAEGEAAKKLARDLRDQFAGTPTRIRLLRALVPNFGEGHLVVGPLGGGGHSGPADKMDEIRRRLVTEYLDDRLNDVEYMWPAEVVLWVYRSEEERRALLKDLLYLARRENEDGTAHWPYDPHADESSEIKAYLRDNPPADVDELSDALAERFPNERDEVGDEVLGEVEGHTSYYTSADGPGPDATWSVYREKYASPDAAEPIDGTQEHVSQHPTEELADAEARRLQGGVHKRLTALDAFQAIDEVTTQYQHDAVSAERAMSNIAAIIADYESGMEV
jgi:hypothetical protein